MASSGSESLLVTIAFGAQKIPICLSCATVKEPVVFWTVGHLSDAVWQKTGVEPSSQKLIYKGRSLNNTERSLASLGVCHGDRIMLLARKMTDTKDKMQEAPKMESDLCDKLEDFQSKVEMISFRYSQHVSDMMMTMELTGLKSCKKFLLQLHEDSMKLLETIDCTHAQDNVHFKKERKVLVNTLQNKLDECEKRLAELSEKIQILEQRH